MLPVIFRRHSLAASLLISCFTDFLPLARLIISLYLRPCCHYFAIIYCRQRDVVADCYLCHTCPRLPEEGIVMLIAALCLSLARFYYAGDYALTRY